MRLRAAGAAGAGLLYFLTASLAAADSAAPIAPPRETAPEISVSDLRAHVGALASEAMEGRLTGEAGGRRAADYVAEAFAQIGLTPAGDDGSYFNAFEFSSGLKLGAANALTATLDGQEVAFTPDVDWRPMAYSKRGASGPAEVVFAGYGIVVAAEHERGLGAYDSYGGADLSGKWALVWRGGPGGTGRARRRQLMSEAAIFHKASQAEARGAIGLLVAGGPGVGYRRDLPPLSAIALKGARALPVIAITEETAERLLRAGGVDPAISARLLSGAQLDGWEPETAPRALKNVRLSAEVSIIKRMARGRNIVARLSLGGAPDAAPVVIGAHVDHLGRGGTYASMARADEQGLIHYGADDNASGVAALLEIAEHLAAERAAGRLSGARDVVFAAWAAEEYGLIGSKAYLDGLMAARGAGSLEGVVASYLNMDMVGRLETELRLSGLASSPRWAGAIAEANAPLGLPLRLEETPYVPTDASAFYRAGAPVLAATTGSHQDYHTPRDQADRVNYDGVARIARLIERLAVAEATEPAAPRFAFVAPPPGREFAREQPSKTSTLGLMPIFQDDAAAAPGGGVALEGVIADGPAAAAGVRAGDRVTGLGGAEIADAEDFAAALKRLEPGHPAVMTIERGPRRLRLTVKPEARE